jgi:hypothetical protein
MALLRSAFAFLCLNYKHSAPLEQIPTRALFYVVKSLHLRFL